MAELVFGMNQSMNQSLYGYVDHTAFAPGPMLLSHFIEAKAEDRDTASEQASHG